MKPISFNGGVLKFRVPDDWIEEYDEDEGGVIAAYYEDDEDSGTLELSVLSLEAAVGVNDNTVVEILEELGEVEPSDIQRLPSGNAIAFFAEEAEDDGEDVIIYHWLLSNVIPPAHGRIAVFTFTLRADVADQAPNREAIRLLDTEIRTAQFHETIGELEDLDGTQE